MRRSSFIVSAGRRALRPAAVAAYALLVCGLSISAIADSSRQAQDVSADLESYRNVVERTFLRDRGGTVPGYAACVMCHTWQTSVRFSLENTRK